MKKKRGTEDVPETGCQSFIFDSLCPGDIRRRARFLAMAGAVEISGRNHNLESAPTTRTWHLPEPLVRLLPDTGTHLSWDTKHTRSWSWIRTWKSCP